MRITAYALIENDSTLLKFQDFMVETLFSLTRQYTDNTFIIIAEKKPLHPFLTNTRIIIKPQLKNGLLKKLWWAAKLPAILKKERSNLFISFDDVFSLAVSIPQIIVVGDPEKIKPGYLKKGALLLVNSESVKKHLINKHKLSQRKITVIYPSAGMNCEVINAEEKEHIKTQFTDDKEYFLFNGNLPGNKEFIDLLKSFSHFKKRQQSNFKLLLLTESNTFLEKSLGGYKYRTDVKLISTKNKDEQAMITAAAYAVILPFNANDDLIAALNAMRSAVPVIAPKNSIINEIAADAALYAENEIIKDIGEKMMQVYTDENHRSVLIRRGLGIANKFTREQAAELLWKAIMKALE